ncbi:MULTISPECIES: hypothetical protein [unclassified Spirosoma]|uniref:hypothetical protein n=1 Tax=unclassified Spirosoma TaxID=2621999 RepID=UPI00095B9526|nr:MULTISPECIES: hypothetical protein [unclassified Spirosoma]MBN8823262.1 hypothetical protein [Spirosoma sp.]OJW72590.1 MAG: hypothetical protein BGO59_15850 [Spirosoma sp. 48-14]
MVSHALDQRLFDQTDSLTDEHNSIVTSTPGRVDLIDGWLKVIQGNERTTLIEEKLTALRDQLQLNHPDPDQVRALLLDLADLTSLIAQGSHMQEQTASKLENLATTLRKLAGVQVVETR